MSRYIRNIGLKTWLICGLALWLVALVGVRASTFVSPAAAPSTVETSASLPNSQQAAKPAQAGGWSVSDCQSCHEAVIGNDFKRTAHAKQDQNCASCHQGVAEHAKAQMAGQAGPVPSLKTMAAKDVNATCLTCHEKANQASYLSGMHSRRNVACTDCHSIHAPQTSKGQLKTKTDTELCFTCHKAERGKAMRTSHHPVREGKMGCSSCHNPHEGARPKMIKAESINELCYQCHTEKRGPFLFEHAPVREDCVSCHDPHGSNHKPLLLSKQPNVCWNCHLTGSGHFGSGDNFSTELGLRAVPPGSPTGFPTVNSRFIERGCTKCHLNIHGSNSPSGAYFVR